MHIPIPVGEFSTSERLISIAPSLAAAAQKVYDAWEQIDGYDEELGAGGICQDIAAAMSQAMDENGFEHVLSVSSAVGENHVFLVALLDDGIFEVDYPYSQYEQGSGYVWQKVPNVEFKAEHVIVERIGTHMSPDEFYATYSDG